MWEKFKEQKPLVKAMISIGIVATTAFAISIVGSVVASIAAAGGVTLASVLTAIGSIAPDMLLGCLTLSSFCFIGWIVSGEGQKSIDEKQKAKSVMA